MAATERLAAGWWLLGYGLLALLLAAYAYSGFYASDDMSYVAAGRRLLEYGGLSAGFGANRLGVAGQIAMMLAISDSLALAILSFIVWHPVITVTSFIIGDVVFGRRVAALAGLIAAVFPLSYIYAGAALPDAPMSAWIGVGTLLFLLAYRTTYCKPAAARLTAPCMLLFFGSGVALGVAYLFKEYAVLAAVPLGISIIATNGIGHMGRAISIGAAMAGGLAAVMALEIYAFWLESGELVIRLLITSDPSTLEALQYIRVKYGAHPFVRLKYLSSVLGFTLSWWWVPLFAVAFLGVGCAVYTARSRPLAATLGGVGIFIFLYMLFGSGSLTAYFPPAIVDRYYVLLLPFLAPLTAWVFVSTAEWLASRTQPMALRPVLLVPWLVIAAFGTDRFISNQAYMGQIYRAGEVKAFRAARDDLLETVPERPIFVSDYFYSRLASIFDQPSSRARIDPAMSLSEMRALVDETGGFSYITRDRDFDIDPVLNTLRRLAQVGRVDVEPAAEGRYYPAADRWSEIREALDPLIRIHPDAQYEAPRGNIWRAVRVISVSPARNVLPLSNGTGSTSE